MSSSSFQQGVILLEGLIAVLIFSIGILGVVGLQASMIKATADARYRAEAGFIAQQRLGLLWVNQSNLAGFVEDVPGTDISAATGLPNGRRITIRGDASCGGELSCFIVKVTWQLPGSDQTHGVTNVARVSGDL